MSVNSKMTAIADAIRAKTGDTSALTLDQMAIDIANIDTSENLDDVLAEQETLIDDIKTALEGKMSSSEDLSAELAEYTALNAELEEVIDSLPDAGGGVELGRFTVSEYKGPFCIDDYHLPLVIGMTWGEWVSSTLNLELDVNNGGHHKASVDSDSYILMLNGGTGITSPISVDGTLEGRVKADDVIIADFTYSFYSPTVCCFSAGTQVLATLDGGTVFIENVSAGDKVVSYDITTGTNYIAEVRAINIKEKTTDIAEVYFDNGSMVTMNAYHPLYTENGFHSITRYNDYDELVVGDVVKTVDGWAAITNINRYTSDPIITYNLDIRDVGEDPDVDTNDTYYANGIVVKNGFC